MSYNKLNSDRQCVQPLITCHIVWRVIFICTICLDLSVATLRVNMAVLILIRKHESDRLFSYFSNVYKLNLSQLIKKILTYNHTPMQIFPSLKLVFGKHAGTRAVSASQLAFFIALSVRQLP